MSFPGARDRLVELADICERGADQLAAAAADPRGTLESRGYRPSAERLAIFADEKARSAPAARAYANWLRWFAYRSSFVPYPALVRQAEDIVVDCVLNGGGNMPDGTPLGGSDPERPALLYQSGQFVRVRYPGQSPYLLLVGARCARCDQEVFQVGWTGRAPWYLAPADDSTVCCDLRRSHIPAPPAEGMNLSDYTEDIRINRY